MKSHPAPAHRVVMFNKMKPMKYIWLPLLIGLFAYSGWDMGRVTPEQNALVTKLRNVKELESVSILPGQLSRKDFTTEITNKNDLEVIEESLRHTDSKRVGGHHGPVFECVVVLKARNEDALKLAGSVHKQQLNDLYLSPTFLVETKPGVFSGGTPVSVRLPGLGQWVMEKEPKGIL